MNLLELYGPIVINLDATTWTDYQSGILLCNNDAMNHAALLIGCGTDKNTGEDYWLIKNSWG